MPLTEKVLHKGSVDITTVDISKHRDSSSNLAKTSPIRRCSECVGRVECLGMNLARYFAVGQHIHGQDAPGPIGPRAIEDRLIEDLIISKKAI